MDDLSGSGLEGAAVLVTGAAGDIGRATCLALSAAGARIIATDIADRPGALPDISWFRHDVTSPDDWGMVRDDIQKAYGRLDALVNCAGVCLVDFLADISIERWRRTFAINVEAAVIGIQTFLPLLRDTGASRHGGASIVNLASLAGIRGAVLASAYCASKGAITLLTKAAAKEFGALNYPIRVNSVHPGAIEGAMMDSNLARFVACGMAGSLAAARAMAEKRPLGRMGEASEIANAITFLCSTKSSFVTGAEFVIDGGSSA